MSENSRKRSRKSKLEPRKDIEDDFINFSSVIPVTIRKYSRKKETIVGYKIVSTTSKNGVKPNIITKSDSNVTKECGTKNPSPRKFSVEVEVEECDDSMDTEQDWCNDSPDSETDRNLESKKVIKPFNFSYYNSKMFEKRDIEDDKSQIIIEQEPQDEELPDSMNTNNFVIKEEIDPQDYLEYEDDIIQLNHTQIKQEIVDENQKEIEVKKEFENDIDILFRKCTACLGIYPSLEQYIMHLSWHGIVRYSCPDCRETFLLYTELSVHIKSHYNKDFTKVPHDNEENYQCNRCGEILQTSSFFQHWESHIDWTNKEGIVPRVDIKNPQKMDAELRNEVIALILNPDKKKFGKHCIVCPRSFERCHDCKRHLIEHLLCDTKSPDYDELFCQICGHASYNSIAYRKHMRIAHAKWKEIKCEQCGKCFSDCSNLAKHKKVHLTNAYVCETCGKKFIAKKTLKQHVLIHMKMPPLICHTCDKIFYTPSQYKKHLRSNHDSVTKRYICKRCNERFMTLRNLWNHSWDIHGVRKDKTANCPICKEEFRTQNDVKKHMKSLHHMKYNKNNKINYMNIMKIMAGDDDDNTLVIYE